MHRDYLAPILAVVVLAGHAPAQPVDYRVIAASGQPAFGMPAGYTYRWLGVPLVDDLGRVTCGAAYNDSSGANANISALLRFSDGEPEFILQYGDVPLGVDPGLAIVGYYDFVINGRRDIVIKGVVDTIPPGGPGGGFGLLVKSGAEPFRAVVLTGGIAPGTNGRFLLDEWDQFNFSLSTDGYIAFESGLGGSNGGSHRDQGIWYWDPTSYSLELAVREGDPVPQMGSNVVLDSVYAPTISRDGVIVFGAGLEGPGIDSSNNAAVCRWEADTGPTLIVREGDPVPGFPPTVTFVNAAARVNDLGHTLIWGSIEGPGITDDSNQILISDRNGQGFEHVYREGIQAPTLTPGVKISRIQDVFFNNHSEIGFFSGLEGPVAMGEEGQYFWAEGIAPGLSKITRTGQSVPGYSDDYTLGDYDYSISSEHHGPPPVFTDQARLSFCGELVGPNPNPLDPLIECCLTDSVGELRLLAPMGAQIDVSTDPQSPLLRTIESRSFDVAHGSNADDEVALLVLLDTGSAVVLASYADECLADVNGDGITTPADFTAWINAYNAGAPGCDQNNDGQCGPSDFTAWISNFTLGC